MEAATEKCGAPTSPDAVQAIKACDERPSPMRCAGQEPTNSRGDRQVPSDGFPATWTLGELVSDSQRDPFLVRAITPVDTCCYASGVGFAVGLALHVDPHCSESPKRGTRIAKEHPTLGTQPLDPPIREHRKVPVLPLVWLLQHADQTSRLTYSGL